MIFVDTIEKKFAFVLAAARRARQLQGGAPPLVRATGHKATRVAMAEVQKGAVPFELPPLEVEEEAAPRGKKSKGRKGK